MSSGFIETGLSSEVLLIHRALASYPLNRLTPTHAIKL
jgi:hypothetical protein